MNKQLYLKSYEPLLHRLLGYEHPLDLYAQPIVDTLISTDELEEYQEHKVLTPFGDTSINSRMTEMFNSIPCCVCNEPLNLSYYGINGKRYHWNCKP